MDVGKTSSTKRLLDSAAYKVQMTAEDSTTMVPCALNIAASIDMSPSFPEQCDARTLSASTITRSCQILLLCTRQIPYIADGAMADRPFPPQRSLALYMG